MYLSVSLNKVKNKTMDPILAKSGLRQGGCYVTNRIQYSNRESNKRGAKRS